MTAAGKHLCDKLGIFGADEPVTVLIKVGEWVVFCRTGAGAEQDGGDQACASDASSFDGVTEKFHGDVLGYAFEFHPAGPFEVGINEGANGVARCDAFLFAGGFEGLLLGMGQAHFEGFRFFLCSFFCALIRHCCVLSFGRVQASAGETIQDRIETQMLSGREQNLVGTREYHAIWSVLRRYNVQCEGAGKDQNAAEQEPIDHERQEAHTLQQLHQDRN